jgi:hypothetical protein
MGRPPIGKRAMTANERHAKWRKKKRTGPKVDQITRLEAKVFELTARHYAMRDVVARLLAYIALMTPDVASPEVVLESFFSAGDARLDSGPAPSTGGFP